LEKHTNIKIIIIIIITIIIRRTKNDEKSRRLYDATQVMEDATLFCFFGDSDPFSFNKAVIEENKAVIKEKWI
jgi:hypothetical protein